MNQISVVHLVPAMGMGGIEISTAKIALDQKRRGCNVAIVCLYSSGYVGNKLERKGIEVIELNLRRGLGMINLILPLWRICLKRKPDVLQVNTVGVEIPVAIATVLGRIRKRILIIRSFAHYKGWRYWRAKLRAIIASICFDRIICISNALKEHEVRSLGRKPEQITVIWNGVDIAKFSPRPLEPFSRARALVVDFVEPDTLVVGMGAQLEKFKDIPTLMKAAVLVKARRPKQTLFVVAGCGSQEAQLKALALQLEIEDCFKFVGMVADMPKFLNAIDVLALTSPFEGLGVIILEAMATGKPVVTTDSGGIRDCVTDGKTGLIVSVGDDKALAASIIEFIDNRELAHEMGQAGLRKAREDFTIEKYTGAYWDMIVNSGKKLNKKEVIGSDKTINKLLLGTINPFKWGKILRRVRILVHNVAKYGNLSSNPNTERYWDNRLSNVDTFWRDENYPHILDLFPQDKAFSLLDIGCAIGDGCELLQQQFPTARIAGCDISRVGIQKAKKRSTKVQYFVLDVLRDTIPDKYDYITIVETLEHFDDPFVVVDKCLRHVGESLIISAPYKQKKSSGKILNGSEHRRAFDEETFGKYNCRVVRITDFVKSTQARCIIYEIRP